MRTRGSIPPLPRPEQARWQPLRAGFQNIWEYENQRFLFHRGRLLLRGRNESGKTKALELLLPFLLDANMAPQRLDPFGSTSRSMYWNLINDRVPADSRIGYVWLEFGRRNGEESEYFTIGAGLRAKRSNPGNVDVWFFAMDDLRVDEELDLTKDRVQLTPKQVGEALSARGMCSIVPGNIARRSINASLMCRRSNTTTSLRCCSSFGGFWRSTRSF